jgi:FKBP-type peptidyl-prolyl cis-trans isomerase SlyD
MVQFTDRPQATHRKVIPQVSFMSLNSTAANQKRVISFHYTLTNTAGETIDTSRDSQAPFAYIEGSGQIIPGLEKSMALLSAGDKRKIEVSAKDAYGTHDAELIVDVPRSKLPNPDEVTVGDQFQASGPNNEMLLFRVIEVNGDQLKLDGNHPLAGEDLVFDVEVIQIRNATNEELAHGHVHGPGGHHH